MKQLNLLRLCVLGISFISFYHLTAMEELNSNLEVNASSSKSKLGKSKMGLESCNKKAQRLQMQKKIISQLAKRYQREKSGVLPSKGQKQEEKFSQLVQEYKLENSNQRPAKIVTNKSVNQNDKKVQSDNGIFSYIGKGLLWALNAFGANNLVMLAAEPVSDEAKDSSKESAKESNDASNEEELPVIYKTAKINSQDDQLKKNNGEQLKQIENEENLQANLEKEVCLNEEEVYLNKQACLNESRLNTQACQEQPKQEKTNVRDYSVLTSNNVAIDANIESKEQEQNVQHQPVQENYANCMQAEVLTQNLTNDHKENMSKEESVEKTEVSKEGLTDENTSNKSEESLLNDDQNHKQNGSSESDKYPADLTAENLAKEKQDQAPIKIDLDDLLTKKWDEVYTVFVSSISEDQLGEIGSAYREEIAHLLAHGFDDPLELMHTDDGYLNIFLREFKARLTELQEVCLDIVLNKFVIEINK